MRLRKVVSVCVVLVMALCAASVSAQTPGVTDSEVAVGVTFGKGALEGVHRGMKAVTGKATLIGDVLYQVTDRVLGATVDSFAEGMQQIQHFTTMGLTGPITFGANRHHGLNAVRLMRAKKAAAASYEQVTGYQTFAPLV